MMASLKKTFDCLNLLHINRSDVKLNACIRVFTQDITRHHIKYLKNKNLTQTWYEVGDRRIVKCPGFVVHRQNVRVGLINDQWN